MRIVIAGGGDIAFQFARQLSRDRDIVVLEGQASAARRFESLDVQVVHGSPTDTKALRAVGLDDDDRFIACSESDERNLVACLAVKRVSNAQTICFVSREEYYESFRSEEGDEELLGIDQIIWPQLMLAQEISRIVLVPDAIDVEVFAKGRVWLMEYRMPDDSPLLGRPLREAQLPRGLLVVAAIRDGDLSIPSGETVFQANDKVVFMGRRRSLSHLAGRYIRRGPAKVSDVTIIGGGNVGLTLAKMLEEEGLRVKLIELSRERCEAVVAELHDSLVLQGDGTDLGLLESEQINRSDVLVSVTSDDDKNLLCSLLARQMRIPKIITRVNKPANVRLFEGVGIDVPLNPRATAVHAVLNSLHDAKSRLLATLEQGRAQVVELEVPYDYPVTRVDQLPAVKGAIIGAIVRRWRTIVPHGDDYIRAGDHLLVVCSQEARDAVLNYF